MNAALVKIDVAAADLNMSIRRLEDLVDGGTLLEKGLAWVFNLANDVQGERRALRFWRKELQARLTSKPSRYSHYELDWVVNYILPEKRENFHAGEVDQMFQIRPRTRLDFPELAADLRNGRNFYSRATLVEFLKRRWIGPVWNRKTSINHRGTETQRT